MSVYRLIPDKDLWVQLGQRSSSIEVKGQIYVFFLFPPRSLGRSSPNLEGRWRAAPDISLRGSFFERSRSSRSKVKFMVFFLFVPLLLPGPSFFERSRSSRSKVKFIYFFFLFVPLLLPGPWTDLHQTWWEG